MEALDDRDVKKENENSSVGLVLCVSKNDAVVEYSLSRNLSPAMIADYQFHFPNKEVLENKLREITESTEVKDNTEV